MKRSLLMLVASCSVVVLLHASLQAQLTTSRGFLRPTSTPGSFVGKPNPILNRLCGSVTHISFLPRCPGTLTSVVPSRNFLPPVDIAADLPHLRLDLVLKRLENKTVSGAGIAPAPLIFAYWIVDSAAATDQEPDPALGGVALPVPGPNDFDVYDESTYLPLLYSGTIANGCSPATVFDVQLDSRIDAWTPQVNTIGQVHLSDTVIGNGFYVFKYTIRATDSNGSADFIFSGDARVYCTAQAAL